ncbi:ATP-binding cassette domain-containing protein [Lysobacter korlensis]|uniref:ATP-binding cassette domain-containing protein n=1 Tax=Lysobacter korlensis TaxID=553636 RepID=A0ABV6RRE5_9GAMM
MTAEPILSSRGLSKTFTVKKSPVHAVVDLNLDVGRGELVAFLGPNGAGKSTSLRMLTTLLPPTSGTATVVGFDIRKDPAAVRRRIGYIGQGTSGGHSQRVRDEMLTQGAFYGMSRAATVKRTDELLESLDLAGLATRTILKLSGGQKRRLDIALGLIHSPELLFLDEPSTGLDPQSRANLWKHIHELRQTHGTTIFVTTHYLEEADRHAERVLVMDKGRVIADDTAPALKSNLAGDVIGIGVRDQTDEERARTVIDEVARPSLVSPSPAGIELTVDRGELILPALLRALDAAGIPVSSATLRQPTLDDVFLALTGRSLRDAGDAPASDEEESAVAEPAGAPATR